MKVCPASLILFAVLVVSVGAEEFDPRCDVNPDGVIDERDIFRIQQQWQLVQPTPTPATEPEIVIDLPGLPADAMPLVMVRIPAGSFQMGSNDDETWSWCIPCEQPVHTVTIGYDFYMGKYEITQGQWLAVMGTEPASGYGDGNDHPVYPVSWDDCQVFVSSLNDLVPGGGFRIPSEAEWEYACRGGTTTRFSFGDSTCVPNECNFCSLSFYAWWCWNNGAPETPEYGTKVVGGKLPNPFGLHDIHGNMLEWCEDDWHESYSGAPANGDPWVDSPRGMYRVIRGGSWNGIAADCRSSYRVRSFPSFANSSIGLRVAKTP